MNIHVGENSRTKLDSPIFCFVPFENYPTHPRVRILWILKNIPFKFFDAVGWHLAGIVGHLLTNGQEFMICDALMDWLISECINIKKIDWLVGWFIDWYCRPWLWTLPRMPLIWLQSSGLTITPARQRRYFLNTGIQFNRKIQKFFIFLKIYLVLFYLNHSDMKC